MGTLDAELTVATNSPANLSNVCKSSGVSLFSLYWDVILLISSMYAVVSMSSSLMHWAVIL